MRMLPAIIVFLFGVIPHGQGSDPGQLSVEMCPDAAVKIPAEFDRRVFLPGDSLETSPANSEKDISAQRVRFKNDFSDAIRESLLSVVEGFDLPDNLEVSLLHTRIRSSTMQAQPEFSLRALFGEKKKYRIKLGFHVRGNPDLSTADLPEDVLVGWFAHELGHIMDYTSRSNFGMIWFGIKYVLSPKFKKKAEYAADRIAIEHGYCREIIALKQFILDNDEVCDDYKEKISRFYLSVDEVRSFTGSDCAENEIITL